VRAGATGFARREEVDHTMAVQQQAGTGVRSEFTAKPELRATDPTVAALMDEELTRQEETLELIPSENLASVAVLEALGSWLNNKYAEGVPGKRYYGGCQVVDKVENLARDRCKQLFGAEHANVQPHSGSQANMAAYASVLKPGDTVLGMALDQGGHLTHGSAVNFSGRLYNFEAYTVSDANGRLDYDEVRARAHEVAPAMIVAGYSSYPRLLDFAAFEDIARDVGALLLVDMAHFAGLVAGGAHPSPVPHADFVTFTTHKTMRGPWGGVILCRSAYADAVDKSVCPGIQGGPQMHAIAAKAVMFLQCMQPEFRAYAQAVVSNAAALARGLTRRGVMLTTGGTDNHLMVIDLRPFGVRGRAAQNGFDEVGITVNANAFPGHGATPYNPNGIRLGSPSVTSRGMGEAEMDEIADLVATMLGNFDDASVRAQVRDRSLALCRRFPLPYRP
jgi:glycine hydroxymethyltransferase